MAMRSKSFSEYGRDGAGLMNEAPGRQSREQVLLAAHAGALKGGTILGRTPIGALSATPAAAVSGAGGTPGNGAMGSLTVDPGAPLGVYQVRITNPVANAGAFEVIKPDGSVDGDGTVGVAYNGTINFVLSDGSTDFAEDDRIAVTVVAAAGSGQLAPLDLTLLNGGQIADCILLYGQPISTVPKTAAVIARHAEWAGNFVTWPVGITSDQQKIAEAQLATKGILIRHPA